MTRFQINTLRRLVKDIEIVEKLSCHQFGLALINCYLYYIYYYFLLFFNAEDRSEREVF